MSNHEWPKFKAGDRVWSLAEGRWVTLQSYDGGRVLDGKWVYTEDGILDGFNFRFPTLFRNEIKPEDWPQPKAPLPELKDGDPIWVRDHDDFAWKPRRFVRFSADGEQAFCYSIGDKWSSDGLALSWKHWRLPTQEELTCLNE